MSTGTSRTLTATDLTAQAAFNAIFPKIVYDYHVSMNLARHFKAAGPERIGTRAFLAHAESLDEHAFWRAFIVHQMPMFIELGLIEEAHAVGAKLPY